MSQAVLKRAVCAAPRAPPGSSPATCSAHDCIRRRRGAAHERLGDDRDVRPQPAAPSLRGQSDPDRMGRARHPDVAKAIAVEARRTCDERDSRIEIGGTIAPSGRSGSPPRRAAPRIGKRSSTSAPGGGATWAPPRVLSVSRVGSPMIALLRQHRLLACCLGPMVSFQSSHPEGSEPHRRFVRAGPRALVGIAQVEPEPGD